MADESQVKKLLEEFGKGTKNASSLAIDSSKLLSNAFNLAGTAAGAAASGFNFLRKEVEGNLNAFRDLSRTGASFSNDVIGMTVAAKGMRLELKDFQEIVGKNAINFAGLGGNVTRGAEEFAKLSKGLMDSEFVDELRQAGFSNRELNEVLALQASFLKTSLRDDKKSREEAIKGAADLAREMDLMAKLTGKSREAQMEEAKKLQTDQQVQAKLRMLTQGKSDEEAAKIRQNFIKQYTEAESRGFGDAFKEVFATGTIQTKTSATQASIFQEQFAATRKQALATQLGDEKAASAAAKEARVAAAKDFNDTSKNQLLTIGAATGPLFEVMGKTYNAQQTYNEGLEATAKKFGMSMKTEEDRMKVQKKMEEDARAAAAGRDAQGKEVAGATQAMINLGSRAGDVEAALFNKLLTPLNKEIGPGLGNFARIYLGAVDPKTGKGFTQRVEGLVEQGTNEAGTPRTGGRRGMLERERDTDFGLVGSLVKDTSKLFKEGVGALSSGLNVVNNLGTDRDRTADRRARQAAMNDTAPVEGGGGRRGMLERDRQQRDLGTVGMTGELWETPGLKEIGPNVKETILTEKQLKNMIAGINTSSVSDTLSKTMAVKSEGQKEYSLQKSNAAQLGFENAFKEVFATGGIQTKDAALKVSAANNLKSAMPASNELRSAMMSMMSQQQEHFQKMKSMSAEEFSKQMQTDMRKNAGKISEISETDSIGVPKNRQDTATLSDVVASLNMLNKQMGQLIDSQQDLGTRQIRAVKSNNRNLFERA